MLKIVDMLMSFMCIRDYKALSLKLKQQEAQMSEKIYYRNVWETGRTVESLSEARVAVVV